MAKRKMTKKQRQWTFVIIAIITLGLSYCLICQWMVHRENNNWMSKSAFIETLAPEAQRLQNEYHVPASISLAQAALESDFGHSELSQKYYNLYGIKAAWFEPGVSLATKEYMNGQWIEVKQRFRVYSSWNASMRAHAKLLTKGTEDNPQRYEKVLQAGNYQEAAQALQEAGYATDPNYAQKIIQVIETYQLSRYDQ